MPGEVIDRPNPEPLPSSIPSDVLSLAAQPPKSQLSEQTKTSLAGFRRAACYIAAAMIFLKKNTLLEKDLSHDDIKPRLLGHWGTCPGLILVYSHLNRLISNHDLDMIFVVGPGHGAPAILACLWLEGSLQHFYPQYSREREGLDHLISKFSVVGGFPSHINAETPGAIHEGGELGYSLAVSFGAVMDKPNLIVTCVVGDGEAETGPTATAWHACKYIDPNESGAVLPIVHVNGFKISERTIYGCMDDKELVTLFSGYGYQCCFVENLDDIDTDLASAMEWALGVIRDIQSAARSGKPQVKPRWPVIILRTPKGWSGPLKVEGEFIQGSFRSHQVPLPKAKTDKEQLRALQDWLSGYRPRELFTEEGQPIQQIIDTIPKEKSKRLGQFRETYDAYVPLKVPLWLDFAAKKGDLESSMQACGKLLDQAMLDNPTTLRIFSPDELVSNKLDAVFEHTTRNFQWDQFSRNTGGRVIEILSEHCCQGFLQGYTLTGRTGLFPSYESFLGIVHTMMVQFAKFEKMAHAVPWRKSIGSLNYIETSTWARQEHNGFSHQNPSFIGAVLNLKPQIARVYLPPDANCFLSTLAHCLRSKDYINLMVGSKHPSPVFLSGEEAEAHCRAGVSVWKFASTDEGRDPDVVLVGIGTELTFEVLKAAELLRELAPGLRIRVINVTDLMVLNQDSEHPHSLGQDEFESLFTQDRHIHFNYHGYAGELKGLLFGRRGLDRVTIESYREEGSTTTPFDMMVLNHVSRYHVAEIALRHGAEFNEDVRIDLVQTVQALKHRMKKTQEYIVEFGEDPPRTFDTPNFSPNASKSSALV